MQTKGNLAKIIAKKHQNKWVAISRDYRKIIDYSKDLITLDKRLKGKDVIFLKVLPKNLVYAPTCG